MSMLQKFAKLLGIPGHQAEDALHSERAAHAVLSRRNLFAAAGSLAAGTVLVQGSDLYVNPWDRMDDYGDALRYMMAAAHRYSPGATSLMDALATRIEQPRASVLPGEWQPFNADASLEFDL